MEIFVHLSPIMLPPTPRLPPLPFPSLQLISDKHMHPKKVRHAATFYLKKNRLPTIEINQQLISWQCTSENWRLAFEQYPYMDICG